MDTRSHGKSGKVKPLHYQDMAQDYVEFIKALELQNVTFFGFSDGGILGLLVAMEGGLIDTLIVSGANTYPGAVEDKTAKIMKIIIDPSKFSFDLNNLNNLNLTGLGLLLRPGATVTYNDAMAFRSNRRFSTYCLS